MTFLKRIASANHRPWALALALAAGGAHGLVGCSSSKGSSDGGGNTGGSAGGDAGGDAGPDASGTPVVPSAAWSRTGRMNGARSQHTSDTLADGRVLVTGGVVVQTILASTDLNDEHTELWTSAGNLSRGRTAHRSCVLADGRVLVAGGLTVMPGTNFSTETATTDLYDPTTGAWTAGPQMSKARVSFILITLKDGRVLAAAGRSQSDGNMTAELFDPQSGTWTLTGSLSALHEDNRAALLPDGKVLVVGKTLTQTAAEIYDPDTGLWSNTSTMPTPLDHPGGLLGVALQDGTVLVAAGATTNAQLYDPATGLWTATGSLSHPRVASANALLPSGQVLVAGGGLASDTPTDQAGAELYDPETQTWISAGTMNDIRSASAASLLPSGKVLVSGGQIGSALTDTSELFDPSLN